jgi:hypothetical protein
MSGEAHPETRDGMSGKKNITFPQMRFDSGLRIFKVRAAFGPVGS